MNLNSLSNDDIKSLILKKKKRKIQLDLMQGTQKILLNSLYGCMGNRFFVFFDVRMAEAITLTGQYISRRITDYINEYLNKSMQLKGDFVLAGDTDSCAGDSLVYRNDELVKIEDLYDEFSEFTYEDNFNKSYVKPVSNVTTKSYNTDLEKIEDKPINYVMKHRVKKEMFEIEFEGSKVVVTEDHSVIVKRNGRYISVPPTDLKPESDILIKISEP